MPRKVVSVISLASLFAAFAGVGLAALAIGAPAGPKTRSRRFSARVLVSDPARSAWRPSITVAPEGNIYIVWEDRLVGCPSNVSFARSTDGGKSFSEPQQLSEIACEVEKEAYRPEVAVDRGGIVYVVWVQWSADNPPPWNQVYFTRSTDGGQTFSVPKTIFDTKVDAVAPALAAGDPGHVYVVWMNYVNPESRHQIFFCESTDAGETFSTPLQVSPRSVSSVAQVPTLGVDLAGRVYVAWVQSLNFRVHVWLSQRSPVSPVGFSEPVLLSEGLLQSENLRLAVDPEGTLYVTWNSGAPFVLGEVVFRRSEDHGMTFSPIVQLSGTGGIDSANQGLAAGLPGHVIASWGELDAERDVFLRWSNSRGDTWRRARNASGRPRAPGPGDLATDSAGNAYVVFGSGLRRVNPDATWFGVWLRRSRKPLQ